MGKPNIKLEDHVDRKFIRFMGPGSAYNYISMAEAEAVGRGILNRIKPRIKHPTITHNKRIVNLTN